MFKWFNAPVGCIIRASTAVLFLVRTDHLHYSYVCILEGGFRWFKHSWCLNCILSATHPPGLRNHFKALNHGLNVFTSTDPQTLIHFQRGRADI